MLTRLHLGCGDEYLPGSTNIDLYDSCVADAVSDASLLPYDTDSVDAIEADHLIEHFDYVHCRYVLSEWFRVLKPGGTLALETPDLKAAFKNLLSASGDARVARIQWIYGIDSGGLLHKSGFTFNILRDLLQDTGFTEIAKGKQQTHTYEAGLRVSCRKAAQPNRHNFYSEFRKEILHRFPECDSYTLVPIEDHLRLVFDTFDPGKSAAQNIEKTAAALAVCSPSLGVAFIETCDRWGLTAEDAADGYRSVMSSLEKVEFAGRAYTLWTKSRKDEDIAEEFERFSERLRTAVLQLLRGESDISESFQYLLDLEPGTDKILDFSLVMIEARKAFNTGVKLFHQGSIAEARTAFEESVRINPSNPLVYWNLGRIEAQISGSGGKAQKLYENALKLATPKMKAAISREIALLIDEGAGAKQGPVTERWS